MGRSKLTVKKDAMFSDLINHIDRNVDIGKTSDIVPFGNWASVNKIVLDGKQFSFKNHEYLIDAYKDDHPFQVEIKATQLGLTSKALLRVMYGCRYGKYRGIMYLFPSRTDVTDLSKTRLNPLIDDNPDTIGQWIRETDSANVKQIWNSFLYLRGMRSRVALKSAPVDFIVYDELDEAPQKAVDMAEERMAHSEMGEQLFLSNPTLPDYGIDRLFNTTDQQFWLLKCPACNEYTDMVGTFPNCLRTIHKGRVIRACIKCGHELNPSVGQWVAKRPDITERRGRQFSQLYAQTKTTTPGAILEKFRTTNNLTDFYNLKIGVAYVEAQNRLSVEEVLECCGDGGLMSSCDDGCCMGVDQGGKLHVVIARRHSKRLAEIVYIGVLKGTNNEDSTDESGWRELDALMKRFHVTRCVIDALPNKKFARNFADRHHGRVYMCYYNDNQKGSLKWNDKDMMVQGNRTETLDASHNEIMAQNILLPRKGLDIVQTFATHLHNVAKKLLTDEESGSSQYVYLKLGEDHLRHAYNYLVMSISAPELLFPELL